MVIRNEIHSSDGGSSHCWVYVRIQVRAHNDGRTSRLAANKWMNIFSAIIHDYWCDFLLWSAIILLLFFFCFWKSTEIRVVLMYPLPCCGSVHTLRVLMQIHLEVSFFLVQVWIHLVLGEVVVGCSKMYPAVNSNRVEQMRVTVAVMSMTMTRCWGVIGNCWRWIGMFSLTIS